MGDPLRSAKESRQKDLPITSGNISSKKVEDIIIRNAATDKIVPAVFRNWCSDEDVLEWVSKIVDAAGRPWQDRVYVPLGLAWLGKESSLEKRPSILPPPEELEEFDFQTSSAYALLRRMALHRLPGDLLSDLNPPGWSLTIM